MITNGVTKIEYETMDAICRYLPRITKALEELAKQKKEEEDETETRDQIQQY